MGRALEPLLQGLGYDTLLIEESGEGKPEELLRGIQLLLAAPTADTDSRERFLADMRSTPATATIPVLTLSTAIKEDAAHQPGFVLWPCRLEDLRTEIQDALISAADEEKREASSQPVDPVTSASGPSVAKGDAAGGSFSPRLSFGSDPWSKPGHAGRA